MAKRSAILPAQRSPSVPSAGPQKSRRFSISLGPGGFGVNGAAHFDPIDVQIPVATIFRVRRVDVVVVVDKRRADVVFAGLHMKPERENPADYPWAASTSNV